MAPESAPDEASLVRSRSYEPMRPTNQASPKAQRGVYRLSVRVLSPAKPIKHNERSILCLSVCTPSRLRLRCDLRLNEVQLLLMTFNNIIKPTGSDSFKRFCGICFGQAHIGLSEKVHGSLFCSSSKEIKCP